MIGSASAIYEGAVTHRRLAVREHEFSYRLAMVCLDLEELPSLLGGALLDGSLRVVRFERSDYLGDPRRQLVEEVRDRVEAQTASRPLGPVLLLTQLRSFGHCFNPVSFYYCLDPSRMRVQAAIAEVTNTPWGERHAYVLQPRRRATPPLAAATTPSCAATASPAVTSPPVVEGEVSKRLHVSPFIDMNQTYSWALTPPGKSLLVRISASARGTPGARGSPEARDSSGDANGSTQSAAPTFAAALSMRRIELTRRSLARITARYPAATLRVLALIYVQAARLRIKGVPVHPHPPGGLR